MSKLILPLLLMAVVSNGVPRPHEWSEELRRTVQTVSDPADCERQTFGWNFCKGCAEGARRTHWQFWFPLFSESDNPPTGTNDSQITCDDEEPMRGNIDLQRGCQKASTLAFVVYRTKIVNRADFILESLILIGICLGASCAKNGETENDRATGFLYILVNQALSVVTWILQIVALVDAFHVHNAGLIKEVMEQGCFGYEGTIILNEIGDGFKTIRWLGIVELLIGLLQFVMTIKMIQDVEALHLDKEAKHKFDAAEFSLELAVIILDVLLSGIDYFKFTLDLERKAASIFESWTNHKEGHGLKVCAFQPAYERDCTKDTTGLYSTSDPMYCLRWFCDKKLEIPGDKFFDCDSLDDSAGVAPQLNMFVLTLIVLLAVASLSRR